MPKVTKIVNGEYIGGEKYTITDAGDGKSIISFSPDTVLKEGTPVGAEILNEMQKNGVYSLVGTRNISGQKEIYTCNIEGIVEFGLFDIILIMTPNITNTTQNIFIDLSGTEFQIIGNNQISIGDLKENGPYILKLTMSTKKAFLIGNDKLDKGTYLGNAGTLNEKIDVVSKSKLNNTGDNMIGFLNLITTKDTTSNPGTIILKNDLSEGNNGGIELDGYYKDPAVKISNFKGNNYLKLNPNGSTILTGNNLETVNKEIFNGVNEIYEKIIGNSGLKFDGSTVYIQTPGNKYVDTYYLDQNNKKMYRCIQSTAATINSSDYFVEETNNILAKIEKWTTGGAGWGAIAIRNYNIVTLNIDISSVALNNVLNVITIPERFRPVSVNKYTFPLTAWLGNNAYGTISINKNGTITSSRTDIQDTTFNITMTYLI